MTSFLRLYNHYSLTKPHITGSISAAILFGTGDVIAQQAIEKKGKNHDFLRTARLTFYGGCIFAPIVGRWYILLERLPLKSPPLPRPVVAGSKVFCDQFILTPPLVGFFFTTMTYLEGKGWKEAKEKLDSTWLNTLQKNWMVFIPVQCANFFFVPVQLRLLLVNVVSLFWNTYLSYANSQSQSSITKIASSPQKLIDDIKDKV